MLFALALTGIATMAFGQSLCDLVQIGDIRYDAFQDSTLLVEVINNSGDIFSYPGFILYDAAGDTIAKETVNFFGIGQNQISNLTLHPDAGAPTEVTGGKLELWVLFYDSLACTFPITQSLCPDTICNSLAFSLGNIGGALTNGTYTYSIKDELGNTLIATEFSLEDTVQLFEDHLCLPNGDYTLEISTDDNPVGGQPYFLLYEPASLFYGSSIGDHVSQSTPTTTIPFSLYGNCPPVVNSTGEILPEASVEILAGPEGVWAIAREGQIKDMLLYDLSGRLMSRKHGASDRMFLPSGNFRGMYLVQLILENGARTTRLVFLPW